jgi:hypothetical protein
LPSGTRLKLLFGTRSKEARSLRASRSRGWVPGTNYLEQVVQQSRVPDVFARLLAQNLAQDGLLRTRAAAVHDVDQLQLGGLVPDTWQDWDKVGFEAEENRAKDSKTYEQGALFEGLKTWQHEEKKYGAIFSRAHPSRCR